MTALTINFDDESLGLEAGESLLDAALREGYPIASSCRAGVCQSCLVKVEAGEVPALAQRGLNAQQKLRNLALACQLKPQTPMHIRKLDQSALIPARVVSRQHFSNGVLRLRLQAKLDFYPGQFINVWRDECLARPYSIASLRNDGYLELHVKRHEGGRLSAWLHDQLAVGDSLLVSEAKGECFYESGLASKPLLLVGSGTGLAPLYAITRDALEQNHQRRIALYCCARAQRNHYLIDSLVELARAHENFTFSATVRECESSTPAPFVQADIFELLKTRHASLQGWCVFLCGAPSLVKQLQKHCFLNGASMADIHADPFLSA